MYILLHTSEAIPVLRRRKPRRFQHPEGIVIINRKNVRQKVPRVLSIGLLHIRHHHTDIAEMAQSNIIILLPINNNNVRSFISVINYDMLMQTSDIILEIKSRPFPEQIEILEETLRSIRKEESGKQMKFAAEKLYDDYATDKGLTEFTSLDLEQFYESR